MEVLFIVVNDLDYVDDVLEILLNNKIKGATILESQGLAQAVVKSGLNNIFNIGLFASDIDSNHPMNKTIMSVMKKEKVTTIVQSVRELLRESEHIGAGFMFSLPVSNIYLLNEKN